MASEQISVITNALVIFFAKNWYPKIKEIALNTSPINCQKNRLDERRHCNL